MQHAVEQVRQHQRLCCVRKNLHATRQALWGPAASQQVVKQSHVGGLTCCW